MPRSLLTALAVVVFTPLTAQAQSRTLHGAWTITEVSVGTPDTSWTEANPQQGLLVFLEPPRMFIRLRNGLEFSSDAAIDADRLTPFGPFVVNSGAYEVSSGPTLTIQPLVALYPNAISDTSEYTSYHRVDGDTLRVTLSAAWAEGGEVVRFWTTQSRIATYGTLTR